MSRRSQTADHRGNFKMFPDRVLKADAWKDLSFRARAAMLVLLSKFNGNNNGNIGLSIVNLGMELGNQNHAANSKALLELIDHGFMECTIEHSWSQNRAREYRITFISTGEQGKIKATNEWQDWRPKQGNGNKKRLANLARRKRKNVATTTMRWKVSIEDPTMPRTETSEVGDSFHVADTTNHIVNHPRSNSSSNISLRLVTDNSRECSSFMSTDELRQFCRDYLNWAGSGGQTKLANSCNIPGGTLSKFLNGRGLNLIHRKNLQLQIGRSWPLKFRPNSTIDSQLHKEPSNN